MKKHTKKTHKRRPIKYRNVYHPNDPERFGSVTPIPKDQIADERHIDILHAGWKQFCINIMDVAKLTGMKSHALYAILAKRRFASKKEAALIDKAMVHIILEQEGRG